MRAIKKGATDQSVVIRIVDSADGTPETGVVYNTSGIDLWYRREGAVLASITEATLSALDDAHSDGGVLHIGDGYYRLDLPDAAVASGSNGVMVGGTVTGMVVIGTYIHLVDYDPQNAVRLGLTALPDAAADAAGGLPISDAGGLDLDAQVGTKINDILTDTGTTLDGKIDTIDTNVDSILVDTAEIGAAGAGLTAVPWNAAWDAEVQSEVDDALVAQNLDHLVKIAVDTDFATTVHTDSIVGQLAQTSDGGFSRASDSLEAVRDRGDSAWITATGFSTLDAAGIRTAVGLASANLDMQLVAIDDYLDTELAALTTTIGVAGAGLSGIPKTGFKLASDGLDSISVTRPSAKATTFPGMVVQLFYRLFGKVVYNTGTGTLKNYAADGTTETTSQAMSDSAGVQTQGEA